MVRPVRLVVQRARSGQSRHAAPNTALRVLVRVRVNPFGLPRQWEWSNYADILFSGRYWQLLRNSLIMFCAGVGFHVTSVGVTPPLFRTDCAASVSML